MGLSLLVGALVTSFAGDPVTGVVAGVGAGGVAALRMDADHSVRDRVVAVLAASAYTLALVHTVGGLALLPAPIFPFTAIGIADHLSERPPAAPPVELTASSAVSGACRRVLQRAAAPSVRRWAGRGHDAGPPPGGEQAGASSVLDRTTPASQRAVLGDAPLGGEVDVDDAEPLRIALGPLEVVEQRPHEEAAQVDAGGDGVVPGPQVGVEEGDAVGVADPPVVVHPVGERATVLVDVERGEGRSRRSGG